ncbi:MAG: PIN domain-containing protein [Candidatus Anammoxibacter sp.]
MSDRFFIDTNVFAYSFDNNSKKKQRISNDIISRSLSSNDGIISYQVVQEFLNISTRKFKTPIKVQDSKKYLDKILFPLCEIFPTKDLFEIGLDIQSTTNYSFYDSMIIASAIIGKCKKLYTEDLNNGHKLHGVTIVDPFK